MKITALPSILFAMLFAAACGTPAAEHDHAGHDLAGQDTLAQGHGNGAATVGNVQLDNGKTWAANPETTDGIAAMQSILDNYDPAMEDSTMLKEELVTEFQDIFAKCTMTGEAHEQLHNYLMPVKGMLDQLGNAPSDAQLEEMSKYLGTYGNYFH